jgi:hypothetical protein
MFVTRIRPGQLNVRESYKCGQLLLQTAEMRGLNELNLKEIWSEGEVSAILFNFYYLNIRININN